MRQSGALLDDRDQDVGGNRDPDLGLHRVFAGAEEGFDAQVLFDPFEEQLDLPTTAIELGDGEGRQAEVVGEEHQGLGGGGVAEANAAQGGLVVLWRVGAGEHDGLVADQAGTAVDVMRIAPLELELGLGASDKEAAALLQAVESGEVEKASVHDVEGAGLGHS